MLSVLLPRRLLVLQLLSSAVVVTLSLITGCGSGSQAEDLSQGLPPVPVELLTVSRTDITVNADYVGQVRGSREVEVRAQVGGILEERLYREGTLVQQDEPLFRIDPQPYQIALQQAEAELADARAGSNQAERDWDRVQSLFGRGAVSERDRDQALSQKELTAARVALAEAGVARARLNLDYSLVKSPLTGVVSLEQLPEGSLVAPGALLTTLIQLDPVHVRFSLPQRHATPFLKVLRGDSEDARQVRLMLTDGSVYEQAGAVDFADSRIDPDTGNVSVRAVFPNPDRRIVPGQFLRVQLAVERLENEIVIPQEAVLQGPAGPLVFVVDGEGVAHSRTVALGPVIDQGQVIRSGLEAGDRLVISGQVALRQGISVRTLPDTRSE